MATGSNVNVTAHSPLSREGFIETAVFVERDFRKLVETLQHALDCMDPSDPELRQQVSNTKTVTERGLRLSKLLTKMARGKR